MVVQHNLSAMNANRMLGITQGTLSKSTEKLSSGYKVNRAADDAAGLAISEKMRKQIRGLNQASANAEDGISAVQTAEGALTEVHDMLQRMNELANKAANGTNSEADRQTIQDEISQLTTEIDRVAETTKFNETYLLKGDGTKGTKTLEAHDAGLKGKLVDNGNGKSTFTADSIKVGSNVSIGGTTYEIVDSARTSDFTSIKDETLAKGSTVTQDGVTYTVATAGKANDSTIKLKDADGNDVSITIKEGATYTTSLGVTTTLVGDSNTSLDTGVGKSTTAGVWATNGTAVTNWAAGDKIVDKDGVEYTYVAANGTAPDGSVVGGTAGFYKSEGALTTDTPHTVTAGDKYTVKLTGETGYVENKGITTVEDMQQYIRGIADGKEVTIKDNISGAAKKYTIGVSTKEDGTAYTADDVAALITGGQYVSDNVNNKTYYAVPEASDGKTQISMQQAYKMMEKELKAASDIGADEGTLSKVVHKGNGEFEITQAKVEIDNELSFALHVGADADMTNKISVGIQTMSSAGLGVKNLNVADDSGKAATYAIDAISDAIEKVSKQRSLLGAVQNRLEHTIKNLDNVAENTTSAESAIRDTDMATEMVKYSNANILAQAGQSMLAQANQSNQGVLSLLG